MLILVSIIKKMMKTFYTIVFIFFLFVKASFSQTVYDLKEAIDLFKTNRLLNGEYNAMLSENDIQGSPYLNDEFISGSVYTTSKTQYANVLLRYNIYNDQIEFKTAENNIQALAAPETVELVEFGDYKLEYIPYALSKKIRRGFFELLEKGAASLYKKPQVFFKDATQPGAYKEAEPAAFVRKADEYFIRIGLNEAQLVGNKKDLIAIFPDNQDKIEAFIKNKKIKTNNSEDLKELVKFYNSL